MAEFFGWKISRDKEVEVPKSFTPEETDDGAAIVIGSGSYGTFLDLEGTAKDAASLITKYREMYNQPECQLAVDEIINEVIVAEDDQDIVKIKLDGLIASARVKEAIEKEWKKVSELLNFNTNAYSLFQRFYVDSQLKFHIIVNPDKPRDGILETRYVDPRKLQKVRVVKRERQGKVLVHSKAEEFYVYNDKGFKDQGPGAAPTLGNQGLKIASDAIAEISSGLMDPSNRLVLGFLHKAIKPLNMLRQLEDATVIYRISRAPERRIFYIDIANLPKAKAEQYLKDMQQKHKNRLIYESGTGEIKDSRKYQTMLEDYWFPTRGGSGGTKVETLPSGQNLGQMDDVNYFRNSLWESLNVPLSRRQEGGGGFNLGRSSEISRDELKFQKFVNRLRKRFGGLLIQILGKQLILRGIITIEDWDEFKDKIQWEWTRDNYFAELKDNEILTERLAVVAQAEEFRGIYFSGEWIKKNLLKQTEEEIEEMEAQMKKEKEKETIDPITPPSPDGVYQDFGEPVELPDSEGGMPPEEQDPEQLPPSK